MPGGQVLAQRREGWPFDPTDTAHASLAAISRGMLLEHAPPVRVLYDKAEYGFLLLDADMPEAHRDARGRPAGGLPRPAPCSTAPRSSQGHDVAKGTGAARLVDGHWLDEELD